MTKELEDLRKKLAEEKKERNDKHVAHRNEMAILKAENEDLKRRVGFNFLNLTCWLGERTRSSYQCVELHALHETLS